MKGYTMKLLILIVSWLLLNKFCFATTRDMEIRLKVGEDKVLINGSETTVQKPYLSNGITMVPLRIIIEAFGAKIEWDERYRSILIIGSGINIQLFIDKKTVFVNGSEKKLLSEPRIISGITMVPLRFISENFGARVNYNNKTGEITVSIPIKDFESRFRYIREEKIGDSYYGWSIAFPKGCIIVEKQTSGIGVLVKNQEEGYYYYIYNVLANPDITNENDLLNELTSYIDDERIVSQTVVEKGGYKWAVLVLESENEVYEYRAAIKNRRIYQIHFYISNKDEFFDPDKNKKFRYVIDSFDLNYKGGVNGIKDVSEIKDGLYTYKDKQYGWSIDLLPTMNVVVKEGATYYKIIDERGEKEGLTCKVEFYSVEPGEDLNSYVNKKIDELYEDINRNYLGNLEVESIFIKGLPAKKVKYRVEMGDITNVLTEVYLVAEGYKYRICLYGDSGLFTGDSLKILDKIIKSFLFVTSKKIGKIDDFNSMLRGKTKEYINTSYNWSCKYPAWWDLKGNSSSDAIVITDRMGFLEVYVNINKNTSESLVLRRITEKIEGLKNLKNSKISVQQIVEKSIPMSKFDCEYELSGLKYYYTVYLFGIEDKIFEVHFTIADLVNSKNNMIRINEIWDSMMFFGGHV